MPSGPLIRKNFEATTVLQLFEVVSDSFSIVSDEAHLAPEEDATHFPGASAHTPNLLFRKDPGKRVGPHTNYHPERICSLSIKPITLLIVYILIIIHLPLPLPECISFILRERNVGCKDNSKRYCNNLK